MTELCSCGSGRAFARCHGDPRNAFAREQALLEARQLATMFPSVRLASPRVLAFAERMAAELDGDDELPETVLDEGVALVDESEAHALVRNWAAAYPDQWASVVHTSADEGAAVRAVVRGAIEVAIHERGTTPKDLLVKLEIAPVPAGGALALVLPPFFVWSLVEAHAAVAAVSGRGSAPQDRLQPVEAIAFALIRAEHEQRVRELADSVERELPFVGFPSASKLLDDACRNVRADVAFVRGVAALMLAAYVRHLAPDAFGAFAN